MTVSRLNSFKISILFLLAGSGIGWLSGLSLSPTIASIISIVLALVSASLAFLLNSKNISADDDRFFQHWYVNSSLVAFLIIGLVIGSSAGLYVRERGLLGIDIEERTIEEFKVDLLKLKFSQELIKSQVAFLRENGVSDELITKKIANNSIFNHVKEAVKTTVENEGSHLYGKRDAKGDCGKLKRSVNILTAIASLKGKPPFSEYHASIIQKRAAGEPENDIEDYINDKIIEDCKGR